MSEEKIRRIAVYTRKSVEDAHDARLTSPQAQKQACCDFIAGADKRDESWVFSEDRYFEDYAQSGGTLNRPAIQKLIADIKRGLIDGVVVYSLDRLSRSVKDFTELQTIFLSYGVSYYSVTERHEGTVPYEREFIETILMTVAQRQRKESAARVKQKLGIMAERGMRTGGNPIVGYDIKDKAWVPNKEEARQALDQFLIYKKEKSLSVAARKLNAMGYRIKEWVVVHGKSRGKKKGGGVYVKNTLSRLLQNPVYVGMIRQNGKLYQGQHLGIVPRDLFDDVQGLLRENGENRNSISRDKHDFWLKKLLVCANCGGKMTMNFGRGKNGKRFDYYRCVLEIRLGKEGCSVGQRPS